VRHKDATHFPSSSTKIHYTISLFIHFASAIVAVIFSQLILDGIVSKKESNCIYVVQKKQKSHCTPEATLKQKTF